MKSDPLERWPGYNEQSWQQRFNELDRRYNDMQDEFFRFATQVMGPRIDLEYAKADTPAEKG